MGIKNTCCFAGGGLQQLSYGYDRKKPDCAQLKEMLYQIILKLVLEERVTRFLSGMTLGLDEIFAELVLEIKGQYPQVSLECVIAYEEQHIHWTVSQRKKYFEILENCDKEITLQGIYTEDCRRKWNRYVVDISGSMLAVWDNDNRSRTGQTVRYAREAGRNIIRIHPITMEITRQIQTNTVRI
ncbi:SLOG family protein [Eisenbergiella tayi]|uniref:SLOG family protein n=1 Tax=Eisenbergiella tayi TaxID=1432052 RepID=UPI0009C17B35|nr:SLOG family protein [Eisenbergiella tayi]